MNHGLALFNRLFAKKLYRISSVTHGRIRTCSRFVSGTVEDNGDRNFTVIEREMSFDSSDMACLDVST